MLIIGVLAGLVAALGQAASYLVSKDVLHAGRRTPLQLLVLSNLWVGIPAWLLLPFLWHPVHDLSPFLIGIGMNTAGYFGAQACFFWTIRRVPASRVAPLLGIKIAFVALLAQSLGLSQLGAWQWSAVAMALIAAVAVQYAGQRLDARSLLGVLGTALCFAVADNGLALTMIGIGLAPGFHLALLTVCIMHGLFVIPALFALPWLGPPRQLPWRGSAVYSSIWFISMIALFSSIAMAGLVLGIICQAMRGPLSLPLGLAVARFGGTHLENAVGDRFWRQVLAALLMVAAIAVYVIG
jgi:hypothetical protein